MLLVVHTLLRFRERFHLMVRVTGSPRARQRRMRRTRWSKQSAVSTRSIFKNFHLLNGYLVQLDESLRLYHPVIDVSVFT